MLNVKKVYFNFILKNHKFIIPEYQRGYVWKKNEWEDLYNDIRNIINLKYRAQHYMGNLLLEKKSDNTYEIIDGQQRLITLTIFIFAVRDFYGIDLVKLEQTKNLLLINDSEGVYKSLQERMHQNSINVYDSFSKNIKNAYVYFKEKLLNDKIFRNKLTTDSTLEKIMKKLLFIEIKVTDNSNPYLIFETLNARGIELNIADLVKNHVVKKANDKKFVEEEWNRIIQGFDGDQFETIFKYFYNTKNNKKRLLKDITNNLNSDTDIKNFLKDLRLFVQEYKGLDDISLYENRNIKNSLTYLKHLGTDLYKIILVPLKMKFINELESELSDIEKEKFEIEKNDLKTNRRKKINKIRVKYIEENGEIDAGFSNNLAEKIAIFDDINNNILIYNNRKINKAFYKQEFENALKLIEVLIFRYLVILKKDEKKMRNSFFEIAKKINSNEINTANDIYKILHQDFYIDDEEFENAFSYIRLTYSKQLEYRYNNQGKIVKYILFRLENFFRRDNALDLNSTTNDISIEHIANESSGNYKSDFKYRLGNYTLLKESDNNTAGSDFFVDKIQYYRDSTYLTTLGIRRSLSGTTKTLKPLSNYNEWNENNIKYRQKQLANFAVNIWSLDNNVFKLDN